jgi:hypothetical protein
LAVLSWTAVRTRAVASRPANRAMSRNAATCRHTVISIQLGGTLISATMVVVWSQPRCCSSQMPA